MTGLIDVHAHYLPPVYREALATAGIDRPDGMPGVPDWSPAEHVAMMDRLGIDLAFLSVSSPGVYFGDGEGRSDAVALAAAVNDVAAAAIADHSGRFGGFATLPRLDTDATLAELERALDALGLDGVVLLTNVDGVYLGDPSLEPLMAALDARGAVVFIHPTSPICAERLSLGMPRPMLEFPFDTTRAIVNLIHHGVFVRFPHIRWIVPHAGGTLPFLAERIASIGLLMGIAPGTVKRALGALYFDLAGSANGPAVDTLLAVVDAGHVMYGSDWPFTPEPAVALGARWIVGDTNPVPVEQLCEAARMLLPRARA